MSTFRTVALTVALSFVASLATFIGAYKYLPLGFFEHAQLLGATAITTIQGSDTLSASRTTINNNFSSLNANKVEVEDLAATTSLTALAEIGTITTGTWNASIISTAFGGTGSTTLSQFSVLLGSSTNPIGMVNGLGTAGQFLTSNGAGQAPSWQTAAIDQAANYLWTGVHNFTGNTYIKNLFASSTVANPIVLNTLAYNTPSVRAASSTTLMEDGNGNLSWMNPRVDTLSVSAPNYGSGVVSEHTLAQETIPANFFTASSSIHVQAIFKEATFGGVSHCSFRIALGTSVTATTSLASSAQQANSLTMSGDIYGYDTTHEQSVFLTNDSLGTTMTSQLMTYDNTSPLYLYFNSIGNGASNSCNLIGYTITRNKN